jgi:hypothetical protein
VLVAGIVAVAASLSRRLGNRGGVEPAPAPTRAGHSLRLGWAGLVGAAVVAFFAVLAVSERIAFPDFVYHWGVKGHRYFPSGRSTTTFSAASGTWSLIATIRSSSPSSTPCSR